MKRERIFLSALLGLALCALAQSANAMIIDFGASLTGAPVGPDVILTNQLQGLGVTFTTTDPAGVIWHGPTGSGSYPYSISAGGVCSTGENCGYLPIRVDIDSAITGAFSSVSITGYDGGGDIDTMVMKAFDMSGTQLDEVTITDVYTVPGLTSTVTATGIAWVTFEVTGTSDTQHTHGLFFDDLCIGSCEPTSAPEPGSLALLGLGLAGLGFARRKKTA